MKFVCKKCGGVVEYDALIGVMRCIQCDSVFEHDLGGKNDGYEIVGDDVKPVNSLSDNEDNKENKEKVNVKSAFTLKGMKVEDIKNNDMFDKTVNNNSHASDNGTNYLKSVKNRQQLSQKIKDLGMDGYEEHIREKTYMKIHIFSCTSCGAKMMINSEEASTFCSFCGKQNVVFDKLSEEVQPDVIIPFKITAKQAKEAISKKFCKGKYVLPSLKNPNVEDIRGVYIPFWLFDTYVRKQAVVYSSTGSSDNQKGYYDTIDAECRYKNITADASRKLKDKLSRSLEPFDMSALVPFKPDYLAGYYADCSDVDAEEVMGSIEKRSKGFIDVPIGQEGRGSSNGTIRSEESIFQVEDVKYALLPVWFMTVRYEEKLVIVLVNGQTGKVVCNVPVYKKKVVKGLIISCSLWAVFWGVFMGLCSMYSVEAGIKMLTGEAVFSFAFAWGAWYSYNKYKKNSLILGSSTQSFITGRQEKTWR